MGFFAFLLLLFIIKSARKHIVLSTIKLVFYTVIIILVLIISSAYVDLGSFFSQESMVVRTGAAVIDTIKTSVT